MGRGGSAKLSLGYVLEALMARGEVAEVMLLQFYITSLLESNHGVTPEEAFELSIDDVIELIELPPLPPKPPGYNTFIWGEEAYGRRSG